jgi:glycine oxidase
MATSGTDGRSPTPDLLVIGGGVIGLACAWQAARQGAVVTIVAEQFGAGASYAAAGMIAPVSEAHFGEEALLALNLRSAEAWPRFAEELRAATGLDLGYADAGTLAVAVDAGDRAVLDELWKFQAELGLESTRLSPSRCRELEPLLAPGLRGGLLVPGDHHVDPRKVTAALQAACLAIGVELWEEAVAEILTGPGGQVRGARIGGLAAGAQPAGGVETGREIEARWTLLAAGWRSATLPGLPPGSAPPVRPVKGQILRLRLPKGYPSPRRTLRAVVQGHSVYLVPRGEGELVCGATVEELGVDTRVTGGAVYELLRDAQAVLPCVSEAELVETLAALRPGSPDNAPIVGRGGADGLLVATGHFRHGILLAPITAELIAGLVARDEADLPAWAAAADPRRFSPALQT